MVRRGSDVFALRKRCGIWAGLFFLGLPLLEIIWPINQVAGLISPRAAVAQSRSQTIEIRIPPAIQVPPATESALSIDLLPRPAIPDRAILLIKGLPSTISLSHGRLFESGAWAVPVAHIGELRLISGSVQFGPTGFNLSLVTFSGTVLAETNSSLAVSRASQPIEATAAVHQAPQLQPELAASPEPPPLLPSPPSGKVLESIVLYMQKGDDFLKGGNINMARAFYTQAAELGWAEGALALGMTYDPAELRKLRVIGGIQADAATAMRWYEKAAQLGSVQAQTRLSVDGRR
jgi:hypothetical protein